MAEEPKRKAVKIGVLMGGGPPPGYQWNAKILDRAFDEAMSFLNADQYCHLANQVKEIARQNDPTHSLTIDIRPVEDFYEIREKGGILRNINVRVFYFINKPLREIVTIGVIKKENNGPTPLGDLVTMRRRKRLYLETLSPDS